MTDIKKKNIISKNGNFKPLKSYDNKEFIHSGNGRLIRILSEYLYPEQRFNKFNINRTVIFFGSARIQPKDKVLNKISEIEKKLIAAKDKNLREKLTNELHFLNKKLEMSKYYDESYELSYRLSKWSDSLPMKKKFFICTGGGPGIMEAANRGAFDAGEKTIGLNISLPMEQDPNPYITPELNFEFHYFFMRKFWLVYPAIALIVFPGGFGTIDELMEVLTLRQTEKFKKPRLILLYSEDYWKKIINFDALVEYGMISKEDTQLFFIANTPDEAMNILQNNLFNNNLHK
ncbi:MAG: LOG family protein [Candidatus Kapabacteria bacterium]|nr:LOG family protein [Candidatus Kapabacteria bacterium]